jgi:hypothetical protein
MPALSAKRSFLKKSCGVMINNWLIGQYANVPIGCAAISGRAVGH